MKEKLKDFLVQLVERIQELYVAQLSVTSIIKTLEKRGKKRMGKDKEKITSTIRTERVLQEIRFERSYQDAKWGGSKHDDTHSSFDWIVYITKYLGRAVQFEDVWKNGEKPIGQSGHEIFRDMMVKIAALAVAAIEWHDRGFNDEL